MHILQLILRKCKYLEQIHLIFFKRKIQTVFSENTGSVFGKLTTGRNSVMISAETICISFTWCPVKGIFLRF